MPLAEKVERSGLDLSGRTRPTLAMLPRGNWIRHYYYDFPALLSGGIDQLVHYGVSLFSRAVSAAAGAPHAFAMDRLILAAHSGAGMPAVDVIAEASRPPDEFHVFDGLYGRDPATGDPMRGLETIDRWLGERGAQEPEREGALAGDLYRAADGPFFAQSGRIDRSAPGGRRAGSGWRVGAALSGRNLRGPAFANRAALHARAAARVGRAIQLAGIGILLAVSMAGL